MDWKELLFGAGVMSALGVGWVLWQQLAIRLDPDQRGRKPVGRCCIPDDIGDNPEPSTHENTP